MELVNQSVLFEYANLTEGDFPFPQDGQIYFDNICERHGILANNCSALYYIGGGFSAVSVRSIKTEQYLYQPTIWEVLYVAENKLCQNDKINFLKISRSQPPTDLINFCLGKYKLS
jgi:hypothetical protein